jgi:hypothetical protein
VAAALDNSIGTIGSGSGPLNHFHNVVAKPYGGYVLLKKRIAAMRMWILMLIFAIPFTGIVL